jgi:uncharacterized protein (DUF1015 family)
LPEFNYSSGAVLVAHLRPFNAIRFSRRDGADVSNVIAPPFDVQDERSKAALQAKDPHNIVNVDLPHLPPKAAGPLQKYEVANTTLDAWLNRGVLIQDPRAGFYPYMQTYELHGRQYHRRAFFALVRLSPFGQGQVVPHEKTYQGAIEDRLALMRATRCQMSPIFGLYNDPRRDVSGLLYQNLGRPELSGSLDGVKHDLWSVHDPDIENEVIQRMGGKPVYIADGHHRYTTALTYQNEMEQANGGGPLPPNHPANFCLFALIAMQDDGLLIQPTHRLIGNLGWFDAEAFEAALGANGDLEYVNLAPEMVAHWAQEELPRRPAHTFGIYDGRSRKLYELRLNNADVLKELEPNQSEGWRRLDVAILQRYLLDEVIGQSFAEEGKELTKGYTADPKTIVGQVDGQTYQIAILLQSTPLHALEELGKHNEVMPQKSTYFYPKLATGMVINSLR